MKNAKSIKRLNDLFPPHFDCGKIVSLNPLRFKHFRYVKGDSFRNLRTKSEFYIISDEIDNYQYEVLKGKDDLQIGD